MMEATKGNTVKHIAINSDLDIIVARLRAREVAREMGFGTIDQARISLAAGELARALAHHLDQQGEIIISGVNADGHMGIQVISVCPQEESESKPEPPDDEEQEEEFSKALALVDEGFVEAEGAQGTRVTLMKWLS
jgi:serine/threonine-protein kinase RsbT